MCPEVLPIDTVFQGLSNGIINYSLPLNLIDFDNVIVLFFIACCSLITILETKTKTKNLTINFHPTY